MTLIYQIPSRNKFQMRYTIGVQAFGGGVSIIYPSKEYLTYSVFCLRQELTKLHGEWVFWIRRKNERSEVDCFKEQLCNSTSG